MLLSICIPTNGRVEVLTRTLNSILSEKIDPELFEVVISDNSGANAVAELADQFYKKGLNVVYHKSDEKSYYNLINALVYAHGSFLKLHNDYSEFIPGSLTSLIQYVINNQEAKPQTLFSNGNLRSCELKNFLSFDCFMSHSSYWNTWSSAFSIWRSDLDLLDTSKAVLDENFPHVSLLFANTNRKSYCIDNRIYFLNQPVVGKGGYNIFKLFCVDYIGMLGVLVKKNAITEKTYRVILNDLRDKFIPQWLQKAVYTNNGLTFDNRDYNENIKIHYRGKDYFLIKLNAFLYVALWHVKMIVKNFLPEFIEKRLKKFLR
jgi:hypothetical protein